jgi:hypothetical protein
MSVPESSSVHGVRVAALPKECLGLIESPGNPDVTMYVKCRSYLASVAVSAVLTPAPFASRAHQAAGTIVGVTPTFLLPSAANAALTIGNASFGKADEFLSNGQTASIRAKVTVLTG